MAVLVRMPPVDFIKIDKPIHFRYFCSVDFCVGLF